MAILLLISLITVKAQPIERPTPFAGSPLQRPMRGADALKNMANRMADIAAFHQMNEPALRELLRRDRSLWLDREGRLFYACEFEVPQEGPVGESTNTLPVAPLYPLDQTFKLHSRAGANRTIYLDFDGHDASTSSWGSNGAAPIARPYDTDGNAFSFGTNERQAIQYIWARVAEDFQQYNIDVTTEDPGVDSLKNNSIGGYGVRVVIGGSGGDWYGSAGGVAYLNSFNHSTDRPCWVFPGSLSNSERNIAEAASHEVGHTLGLSHDGKTDGTEYYGGQGNWAPIMGVGYSKSVVQWSRGEYSLANNTEDDLAKMLTYGAAYRTDDYGNTIAAATPLVGVNPFTFGVISTRTDVDFFSFQAGAGSATITAAPSTRGGNLHILLSLYDSGGALITSAETTDSSSTGGVQPVSITRTLASGTYYVSVDGIGVGDPVSTGYSDYASLGQYTVNVSLPATGTWSATAPGSGYVFTDTANWSSAIVPFGADALLRVNNNISGDQTIVVDAPYTLGRLLLGDADASHGFELAGSGTGALRFQVTTNLAGIGKTAGAADLISAPLVLLSDTAATNTTFGPLTLAGNISGAGALLKYGVGPLTLSGTNTFAGALIVAQGTLVAAIPESVSSTPTIEVRSGATLDGSLLAGGLTLGAAQRLTGSGAVTGDVATASGARIAPGTTGTAGTLTFSNALTLASSSALDLDLGSTTGTGAGMNDLVVVAGDLTFHGTIIVNFNFLNSLPQSPGNYTLMTYGGVLTGGATNLAAAGAGNRFTYTFDDSVPGEIRAQVSGAPESLVWQGDGAANAWNTTATNWLRSGSPDRFFSLDSVLFAAGGSASPAVNLSGILLPPSVTVSNAGNYTFTGSGRISGTATLTKQGAGALTLGTSNNFTGATLVTEGSLVIGNGAALGATNAGTTISSTAQMNLNGFSIGDEPLTVSGNGPTGAGAIVNNGATQTNAARRVTLAGNTTFGGSGRWDIRSVPSNNVVASLSGNNFSLTKTGANPVWLVDLGNTGLGNITVNQGTLGFQGTTTMGTSGTMFTVNAGATLALWNTFDNDFNKAFAFNSCTVQNNSGHTIFTGPATLTGTTTTSVGEAATLDLRGAVGGSGGFAKTGAGILRLAGANTFSGNITVSAGTVVAGSSTALGNASGTTTIASGAVLDLAATNLGDEVVNVTGSGISSRGAIINSLPTSQQNALRFVTLTGNTTFGGNGRWDIRANPTGSLLGAFTLTKTSDNDVYLVDLGATALTTITVSEGTLGFQGTTTMGNAASTMTVNTGGIFRLWNTTTNILSKVLALSTGRISNGSGNNTFAGATSLAGTTNKIDVAGGTTLTMSGIISGSGYFEKISTGTLILSGNNTSTGTVTNSAGILVVGAGTTAGSLNCNLVNNSTLIFNRSTDLTHSKIISGTGTLSKQGTNILTLSGANTFAGTTTVSAGTLRAGNTSALGNSSAGTTVANGATLDLNGLNLGAEPVTVAGAGVGGAGAIVNTGATQLNALATVTLTGGTTFGGVNRWDIAPGGAPNATLSSGGQSHALTKVGANTVGLNSVTVDPALGPVNLQQGTLSLERGTTGLGSAASSATVSGGATLALYSLSNALTKPVILQSGATLSHNGPVSGGVNSSISSRVTLDSGNGTISNASTLYSLSFDGAIGGEGNLVKQGAGLVQLAVANTYNGNTLINAGTLKLGSSGSIANTPAIVVGAGAAFDVASLSGGFTLGGAQSLSGNGTVLGNVIANGVVAPGTSIGKLTVTGDVTLAGLTTMEITRQGVSTNDVLSVGGTLTYGGALNVILTGATPLTTNDTFTLFSAANRIGAFSSTNLPVLAAGLRWDLSQLNSAGSIQVLAIPAGNPTIAAPYIADGNLILAGTGGTEGNAYSILTTTNIETPLLNWTTNTTGIFGVGGIFSNAIPFEVTEPQRFYLLQSP